MRQSEPTHISLNTGSMISQTDAMRSLRRAMNASDVRGDSGFSWRPMTAVPASGYMVGIPGFEFILSEDEYDFAAVWSYYEQVRGIILAPAGKAVGFTFFLGVWKHKGQVYLDVSAHVEDTHEAIAYGAENGQLAIWDLGSKQEIALTKLLVEVNEDILTAGRDFKTAMKLAIEEASSE